MYPHLSTEWRHPLVFDVGNNLKGGLDPSRYKECGVSMFASKLLVEEPQWVNLKGKKTANIVERKKETKKSFPALRADMLSMAKHGKRQGA